MTEQISPRPAVFIDRDGTIIKDVDYLNTIDGIEVFDFSTEALTLLREKGYLLIVLSNQSGIGRGHIEFDMVSAIHLEINKRVGGLIDAFYFCPHVPEDECDCRKPAVGMIRNALADLAIDMANSWMIGDKRSDVETGFNAGLSTALVLTGYGESELPLLYRMPDLVAGDLLGVARDICARSD